MGLFGPPNIEKMKAKRDIKGLIKTLGYQKDESVRQAAASALAQIGVPAIEPLIVAFKDEHNYVRQAAAEAMRQIGTPSIEPLIATLSGSDINVRQATVEVLSKIGAPAVERLIVELKHQKENVRGAAAEALIKIGAPAVQPIIAALGEARQAAHEANQVLEQLKNLKPLMDKIAASSVDDVVATFDAIKRSNDSEAIFGAIDVYNKAEVLKNESANMLPVTLRILGHIGDARAVKPLIAAFGDEDLRELAVEALTRIGAISVDPLIAALGDSESRVRWAAARALGQIGAPSVEPLIAKLKNADKAVREVAAEALGQIGDARAVEPLITTLRDSSAGVRWRAASALGKLHDVRAVGQLIAALEDTDKDVRQATIEALDKVGWSPAKNQTSATYWIIKRQWYKCVEVGDHAVGPLIAALKDSDWHVREAVAETLGKIGDTCAVEPLLAALKDTDKDVRQAAVEALDRLGWNPAKDETNATYWIMKRQWDKCVEVGAPAVEPLIAALKDHDESVHGAVAETLGKIGAPAVEPLLAALKDSDRRVRKAVAEILGKIGDTRAVEPLIAALRDSFSDVCKTAAASLARIGAPAVEPLVAAFMDSNWRVHEAAAGALGQIGDTRAVEPLIAALENSKGMWCVLAAVTLGRIGDVRAVEPLVAALRGGQLRQEAVEALDRIGWNPAKDEASATYWIMKRQLDKCVEIGAPAIRPLITALEYDDEWVRRHAAGALGQIGDARAVEPLIATLKDRWMPVCKAAAEALVSIYKTGQLDETQKHLIVAQRNVITEEHSDENWCSYGHHDKGIGVDFPL